jgi:Ca2+/Na+ antiporter
MQDRKEKQMPEVRKENSTLYVLLGIVTALGIVAGVVVARFLTGAASTASQTTGGSTGAIVAIIVCLCAVAAARRRRSEKK